MLTLKCFEQKKNKDGFAGMTADELKFINGGASSCGKPIGTGNTGVGHSSNMAQVSQGGKKK